MRRGSRATETVSPPIWRWRFQSKSFKGANEFLWDWWMKVSRRAGRLCLKASEIAWACSRCSWAVRRSWNTAGGGRSWRRHWRKKKAYAATSSLDPLHESSLAEEASSESWSKLKTMASSSPSSSVEAAFTRWSTPSSRLSNASTAQAKAGPAPRDPVEASAPEESDEEEVGREDICFLLFLLSFFLDLNLFW